MLRRSLATAVVAVLTIAAPGPASAFDFEWLGKIELDAQGLESKDKDERKNAVRALSQYEIAYTKEYLLRALRDPSPEVRHEAGRTLGAKKVLEAAPIIVEWLNEPDVATKKEAAEILGSLGTDEAVQALIRTLGDIDPDVRLRAVTALGRIGTPAVVVPLIGRLEDDKSDVRRVAVTQLEEIGDARAAKPLVGAFNDPSLDVRKAAVLAVGKLGDRAAVPALMRLLRDPVADIKKNAVTSLGNLGAVEAVDRLIEELESGSESYRSTVAYALGQVARSPRAGDAAGDAVRALVEALAHPRLRTAAQEALLEAGRVAVPALIDHLEGRSPGDPATAVRLLRDLGDPRATDTLVAELDRGRISQELLLDALSRSGGKKALIPVLGLLSSNDASVRMLAMEALRPLLGQDPRAADVLVGMLDDDNLEIRILAAEYLGLMRSPRALDRLLALSGPGHKPRLRAASIDAIGEICWDEECGEKVVNALLEVLRDGPSRLHMSTSTALVYAASPESIGPLLDMAGDPRTRARRHVIRALGGALRDRDHDEARKLLQRIATEGRLEASLAAVDALAALGDGDAVPTLRELARGSHAERRRGALAALGDVGGTDDEALLIDALGDSDDRVASAAAWSLGKLEGATPARIDALVEATRRGGWGTAINASAALARLAPDGHGDALAMLIHHRSKLVRVNAAAALAATGSGAKTRKALAETLSGDPSPVVRIAAARALALVGGGDDAMATAAAEDRDQRVREAVAAARAEKKPTRPARNQWRHFYFVDPDDGDARVRQEPYFVIAADGLATALYTDARGEHTEEAFPDGDYLIAPKSKLSQY